MPVSACGSAHPGLDPDCVPCQRQRFNALEASYVRTVERDGEKIAALTAERDQLAAIVAALTAIGFRQGKEAERDDVVVNIQAAEARYLAADRFAVAAWAHMKRPGEAFINGRDMDLLKEWRRLGGGE